MFWGKTNLEQAKLSPIGGGQFRLERGQIEQEPMSLGQCDTRPCHDVTQRVDELGDEGTHSHTVRATGGARTSNLQPHANIRNISCNSNMSRTGNIIMY